MKLQRLDNQQKDQISMIEVAYEILHESNQVYDFNELLTQIQDYLAISITALENKMAIFYTELNADGRFISLGENRWGLRDWYPIDSVDEEIISSMDDDEIKAKHKIKPKRTNVFATSPDDDMIDYSDDDPEDYDSLEEEYEEIEDEEVEDEEVTELRTYASDLDELGDDENDDLEDGIEGELTVIDDEDLEDEDEEDLF